MAYLQSLYLRNFRNIERAQLFFSPKANLIQGDNAQGKTNLLEALYLLSTGRSFRTPHLADLIRQGESSFYLEASFVKDNTTQLLKISCDGKKRKMQHNNTTYPTFTPLLGLLPTVLYAPQDIVLISSGPSERRRFIDLHIAQRDPLYVHHLTRYFKAMKQRNTLLRKQSTQAIEPWEMAMAESAAYLVKKRSETLQDFSPLLTACMQMLSQEQDHLEVRYQPSFSLGSSFYEQLQKGRRRDMHVGASLTGPHRDDFLILVNQKEARLFSSEGQKRCAIAALRLAEWQTLSAHLGFPPLISIDDFGIHLDKQRHLLMQEQLQQVGQLFLTSPLELKGSPLLSDAAIFSIEKGVIFPSVTAGV